MMQGNGRELLPRAAGGVTRAIYPTRDLALREVCPMRDKGTHGVLPPLTTFINHEITAQA